MSQLKIKNGNNWESIPAGGIGVPSGGTTGQVLQKSSNTDYATEWATKPTVINPPDLTKIEFTVLTSGQSTTITSVGGWYWVVAQTGDSATSPNALLIHEDDETAYYAAVSGDAGTWRRASTAPFYFPAGFKFVARSIHNYQPSGLYYAPPIE